MKKLGFLLIVLSLAIIFGACPPLEEDDQDFYSGNVITFDEPFELDVYKWFEILDSIAKERKYVSLDLSKGTYVDDNLAGGLVKVTINDGTLISPDDEYIAFDPFPAASSGKNYILSIIMPTAAQMIKQAIEDNEIADDADEEFVEDTKKSSAFRSFSSLRSVKADNVTLIGNFAFADCTELKEVVFPRVGHTVSDTELQDPAKEMGNGYRKDIGKYAFVGCTGLKEVKFNSAAVIGEYAFKDCTNLSKIDFPEVWIIERNAFEGCESLDNVFFEKASKIGEEAFKNCTGLTKAEFNVKPSRLFTDDPLDITPCVYDSVIFYPSVFSGCKILEVLNVRRAWNVYFSKDVLAYTSSAVDIYLFDEPSGGGDSFGHPQNTKFLGESALAATLKTVNIFVPADGVKVLENSIDDNIAKYIQQTYNNVRVTVKRSL
jgi:hypothetical protein